MCTSTCLRVALHVEGGARGLRVGDEDDPLHAAPKLARVALTRGGQVGQRAEREHGRSARRPSALDDGVGRGGCAAALSGLRGRRGARRGGRLDAQLRNLLRVRVRARVRVRVRVRVREVRVRPFLF